MASLVDMENHAFDPKNNLLNRAQFNELLDLQTESEPDFMEDIVNMYCDDSQSISTSSGAREDGRYGGAVG